MNKTFEKIFAKAKSENRSCFVAFVTGMDPDYESSKQILIELSKYCDCIEIGVSFNTSTSDSSIIMGANDRAIKSGAKTKKIFKLTTYCPVPGYSDEIVHVYYAEAVTYTHLRAHETREDLVSPLLLVKK